MVGKGVTGSWYLLCYPNLFPGGNCKSRVNKLHSLALGTWIRKEQAQLRPALAFIMQSVQSFYEDAFTSTEFLLISSDYCLCCRCGDCLHPQLVVCLLGAAESGDHELVCKNARNCTPVWSEQKSKSTGMQQGTVGNVTKSSFQRRGKEEKKQRSRLYCKCSHLESFSTCSVGQKAWIVPVTA